MKKIAMLTTLVVSLGFGNLVQASVINGDFSTGDLTGWTKSISGIATGDVITSLFLNPFTSNYFNASEALGGEVTLSQAVNTIIGQQYNFNFDFAKLSLGSSIASAKIDGGTVFSTSGTGIISPPTFQSFLFNAVSTSTVLEFKFKAGLGAATYGIDNVSLIVTDEIGVPSVPEPEEWAMMLLGLPLMGFIARRKKNDNNFNFVNAVVA